MSQIVKQMEVGSVPASTVVDLTHLEIPPQSSKVVFVKLDLQEKNCSMVSTNFYWKDVAQDDLRDLEGLATVRLQVTTSFHVEADETVCTVTLHNPEKIVAMMAHMQLHRQSDRLRVLPVFYSDNYLNLAPGESRTVTIHAKTKDFNNSAPLLLLDGYNIDVVIDVVPLSGPVSVQLNKNAQPDNCLQPT